MIYEKESDIKKNSIKGKINLLGIKLDAKTFIIFRIINTLVLFILLLFINKVGFIIAPLVSVVYYFLFEYILLDYEIYKRALKLENDALEFFPIFLLSLKNTKNIKKAIFTTTSIVNNNLSLEFKKVLDDLKIGRSLDESLKILNDRIPSKTINNIIISIIEFNRVGCDISDSITNSLNYIDEKIKKNTLKKYKYIPFKLAFLSITFVFIVLIILILITYYI